ncbi:MAG TPA: hypothetical protein VHA76_15355 [Solirubrobacterales bacterium]|nr:hypothetical protein [Solirubrobacterales bacterium]
MKRLKKGPELKLPEPRVPDFLYDLFHDLKERHLLPLVALLLVAIVAAPIYFKQRSDPGEESVASVPTIVPESAGTSGGGALTVARSQPGLRDPARRLRHARALDPFAHRGSSSAGESAGTESTAAATGSSAGEPSAPVAAVPTEATVTGGESSSSSSSEPPAAAETYVPPVSAGGETEAGGGEPSGATRTRYASEAIDVRVVSVPPAAGTDASETARRAKPKAQVRRDLPELTMLPARATPAVTFMGVSKDGKKALLLVSSDVESIFGEARCIVGSQSCQLLALEPQLPETFVYGPRERTYRIELLKIHQTLGAKPRRAALGATGPTERRGESQGRSIPSRR